MPLYQGKSIKCFDIPLNVLIFYQLLIKNRGQYYVEFFVSKFKKKTDIFTFVNIIMGKIGWPYRTGLRLVYTGDFSIQARAKTFCIDVQGVYAGLQSRYIRRQLRLIATMVLRIRILFQRLIWIRVPISVSYCWIFIYYHQAVHGQGMCIYNLAEPINFVLLRLIDTSIGSVAAEGSGSPTLVIYLCSEACFMD